MRALTWDRLTNIVNTVKPYRGTTNRFPIGDRKHNTKDFVVEERNGEKVYVIRYGFRWKAVFHTREEYLASPNTIREYEWETDVTQKYVSHYTIPRELGIVRSDNTFEFTGDYYGQGDNSIMSGWSQGWFYRSSRHGGMVYKSGHSAGSIFHPIFKGMRIHLDTMLPHSSSEYQIVGRRVSRKNAQEFLKRYASFYTITEVMLKTMDYKTFMATTIDIYESLGISTSNYYSAKEERDKALLYAESCIDSAPLDAFVAFCIAYNTQDIHRWVRHFVNNNQNIVSNDDLMPVYSNLKRVLNKELYRKNPSVMKLVEYAPNEYYPPSEWGMTITVDGKEVEQY